MLTKWRVYTLDRKIWTIVIELKNDIFSTLQQIKAQALITIINYYSVTNNYMFRSIMIVRMREVQVIGILALH